MAEEGMNYFRFYVYRRGDRVKDMWKFLGMYTQLPPLAESEREVRELIASTLNRHTYAFSSRIFMPSETGGKIERIAAACYCLKNFDTVRDLAKAFIAATSPVHNDGVHEFRFVVRDKLTREWFDAGIANLPEEERRAILSFMGPPPLPDGHKWVGGNVEDENASLPFYIYRIAGTVQSVWAKICAEHTFNGSLTRIYIPKRGRVSAIRVIVTGDKVTDLIKAVACVPEAKLVARATRIKNWLDRYQIEHPEMVPLVQAILGDPALEPGLRWGRGKQRYQTATMEEYVELRILGESPDELISTTPIASKFRGTALRVPKTDTDTIELFLGATQFFGEKYKFTVSDEEWLDQILKNYAEEDTAVVRQVWQRSSVPARQE